MRVLIVEDDNLLRQGLTLLLRSEGITVAGEMLSAEGVLDEVERCAPDALITDVRLPPTFREEGLRAAVRLRRRRPGFPVLVLSAYVEDDYATELLADDACGVGYLLKDRVGDVAEFVAALHRVVAGGTAMDPVVVHQLMRRRQAATALGSLTPRERLVLDLMAQGHDNGEICRLLELSVPAVSKHIGSIFSKLGLSVAGTGHRRVQAVLARLNSDPDAPVHTASTVPGSSRPER